MKRYLLHYVTAELKFKRNMPLTAAQIALRRRNESSGCPDPDEDVYGKFYVMPLEELVKSAAEFLQACVVEAKKQAFESPETGAVLHLVTEADTEELGSRRRLRGVTLKAECETHCALCSAVVTGEGTGWACLISS